MRQYNVQDVLKCETKCDRKWNKLNGSDFSNE